MHFILSAKRFLTLSFIFILVLVAFFSIVFPFRCIPWNIMISGPNEGWNAFFAQAAMKGEGLYPSPEQLITNNYPPLSFYAVGFIGTFLGDPILAGRWMAFLGLLTIAFFIFKIVQELAGECSAGIIGAAFFTATMGLFFERYVAMNDQQLFALAIMIAGFYLFLKAIKRKQGYFLAFTIMVFAGFFKHNIITLPASALLWLLVRKEQNNFWKCLAYSVFLIATGFALCYACYGSNFFFNFFTPRRFLGVQEIAALLDLQSVALAVIISFPVLWKHRRESNVALILIMLAVGLGVHFLQRLGSGVDSNSQFGFNIAVAIAAGMAFHLLALSSSTKKELLRPLFLILLLVPLLLAPGWQFVKKGCSSNFYQEACWREQCMLENIKKVQATPGDVVSEYYIIYYSGKPFTIDQFNLEERIQAGRINSAILIDRFKKHQLTKVDVNPDGTWPYDDHGDYNFLKLKSRFQHWPSALERVL